MRRHLKTRLFPSVVNAYELADYVPPANSRYTKSVGAARLKLGILKEPSIVLTALEKKLVTPHELIWDPQRGRLSSGRLIPEATDTSSGMSSMSCLVGAFGTGKTRYLLEKCWDEFGAYFIGLLGTDQFGGREFLGLNYLVDGRNGNEATALMLRARFVDCVNRILLARVIVLETVTEACERSGDKFLPHHWLALQLFPGRFFKTRRGVGINIFMDMFHSTMGVMLSKDETVSCWKQSKMRFVALDDAEGLDFQIRGTSPDEDRDTQRSLLSVIASTLQSLDTHVILAGTRLSIVAACENPNTRLLGTTTSLHKQELVDALRMHGVRYPRNAKIVEQFEGRPLFATCLARAVLLGQEPADAATSIIRDLQYRVDFQQQLRPIVPRAMASEVYDEIRFTAQQWSLRGLPRMNHHGAMAQAAGLALLEADVETSDMQFVIKEPLVIEALEGLSKWKNLINKDATTAEQIQENYIALHAEEILGMLTTRNFKDPELAFYLDQMPGLITMDFKDADHREFLGPWRLAKAGRSQRHGISCKRGEESCAIREIMNTAGKIEPSMVFLGGRSGVTFAFTAKRSRDKCKLLVFVRTNVTTDSDMDRNSLGTTSNALDDDPPIFADLSQIITDIATRVVLLDLDLSDREKPLKSMVYDYHGRKILKVYVNNTNGGIQLLPKIILGIQNMRVKRIIHESKLAKVAASSNPSGIKDNSTNPIALKLRLHQIPEQLRIQSENSSY